MKVNALSNSLQATQVVPARPSSATSCVKAIWTNCQRNSLMYSKGEMSIVGPRPPYAETLPEEFSQLINKYMMRHLVRTRSTGWAQVTGYSGRSQRTFPNGRQGKRDLLVCRELDFPAQHPHHDKNGHQHVSGARKTPINPNRRDI